MCACMILIINTTSVLCNEKRKLIEMTPECCDNNLYYHIISYYHMITRSACRDGPIDTGLADVFGHNGHHCTDALSARGQRKIYVSDTIFFFV